MILIDLEPLPATVTGPAPDFVMRPAHPPAGHALPASALRALRERDTLDQILRVRDGVVAALLTLEHAAPDPDALLRADLLRADLRDLRPLVDLAADQWAERGAVDPALLTQARAIVGA
jgi:hypothetical protein